MLVRFNLLVEVIFVRIHSLLESKAPSRFEFIKHGFVVNDVIRDKGQVQKNHDHVRLLTSDSFCPFWISIVFTLRETVFNQLFSFADESSNIVEKIGVSLVGEDLIPRSSLDSFLWNFRSIKCGNSIWIIMDKSKVMFHIILFLNQFISLWKSDTFEEVWKIFINFDVLACHSETPFLEILRENFLDSEQCHSGSAHEHDWSGPVDTKIDKVIWSHWLFGVFDELPFVFKDLWARNHPISVENQQDWGELNHAEAVICQLIIKSWWESHLVSNNYSFTNPLIEEIEGGKSKENWHSHSVHACNEHNVENSRVLEMNNVFSSRIKILVLSHWGLFGLISVSRARIIKSSLNDWDQISSD